MSDFLMIGLLLTVSGAIGGLAYWLDGRSRR